MSSTIELDQFPNPKERSYYRCMRRPLLFHCTTRIVRLIETNEKEVQDTSCWGSGECPPALYNPLRLGDIGD
jgi:hypothetical protein